MFHYQRRIRLSETDATGLLYFAELLKLATETFEAYLISRDYKLHEMIHTASYMMPIVHAEADYFAPLRVGDQVDIELKLKQQGTSSFTLGSSIKLKGKEVGSVTIVHVVVSKESGKSMAVPSDILTLLS